MEPKSWPSGSPPVHRLVRRIFRLRNVPNDCSRAKFDADGDHCAGRYAGGMFARKTGPRRACRSLQLDSKHGVIESTRQSYSRELADDAGPVLTSASAKDPCVGDALLGEYSLFALRTFTANLSNPALKEFSDAP